MRPSPRQRTREAAYAAHLETVLASSWRLGLVDGRWRLARRPDTDLADRWVILDDTLEAFPDVDPAAERRRVVSWVCELLGVRMIVLHRDYVAAAEGREAFDVAVQR